MKKIFSLYTVLILAVFFIAPTLVTAQQAYVCNTSCTATQYCNSLGVCIENSTLTTPPPGGTPGSINQTYLTYYYTLILTIINSYLVPILIAIAFIVFLYGVYEYFILGAAEEDKRKEGRQFVLWGIIGFVIILSVWSIVNIVQSTVIPAGQNNRPTYPTL